jgi:hypothetical protein
VIVARQTEVSDKNRQQYIISLMLGCFIYLLIGYKILALVGRSGTASTFLVKGRAHYS